jgi:TRAP-type uncharacterized transport system substrate-binding protein
MIFLNNIYSIDLGNILIDKHNISSNTIAIDMIELLNQYNIDLNISNPHSSYDNIELLLHNNTNHYFAIVKKDILDKFNTTNYKNKNIYKQIPAILNLGEEQIHIFASENKEFDFDKQKDYIVYCGDINSDSCIASANIQKAYNFNFTYINLKSKDIFSKLKDNSIDFYIKVVKAPSPTFTNLKHITLIDLPTNFIMEELYTHSTIRSEDYRFLNENISVFSSSRVLITNLRDEQYTNIIQSIIKIMVLNKAYLIHKNKILWENIDFNDSDYKIFLKSARDEIDKLQEEIKIKKSLIL